MTILQIRNMTIDFLAGHLEHVREKDVYWKREFVFAVTAILGEKRLAFMLTMSELGSCYIICPGCENCDEELEFGYFDFSERIEKAEVPAEKWDGESLTDVKQWLFDLFALLDDMEGMDRLCYYFGTYTCPECAHILYGYPKCEHIFKSGKCIYCLWDGSQSGYMKSLDSDLS